MREEEAPQTRARPEGARRRPHRQVNRLTALHRHRRFRAGSRKGRLPHSGAPAGERTAGDKGLLPARLAVPWPAISTGYHVYEVPSGGTQAARAAAASGAAPPLPRRLTPAPLKATTFTDTRVEYGVERCYVVRTAETMATLSVESEGPNQPA